MTNVIEVNGIDALQDILESNKHVVVNFSRPESLCVWCKRFAPHYASAAAQISDVTFVKVNLDENPDVQQFFSITSVPTVFKFKDGTIDRELQGKPTLTVLQLIDELAVL